MLKEALIQHQLWRDYQWWIKDTPKTRGEEPPQGIRFALKDLRKVNLRNVDLREADLREADLRGADLWKADLSGADLRGADLRFVIGNGREVKSIQADIYWIVWTDTQLAIGCKQYPLEKWLSFTDEEKSKFASDSLEYLNKWLPILDSMGVFDSVK